MGILQAAPLNQKKNWMLVKAASKQEDREAVEVDASGQTQWIIDHANKDHEDNRQNNLRFIKRTWSTSH